MKYTRTYFILMFFTFQILARVTFAQADSLRMRIENVIKFAKGKVGVNIRKIENGDILSIKGNSKFPMQSVYKFPLALTILNQVDKGKLSLDQKIHISKNDLLPVTWSPLREKYPDGNDITLDELLYYTVSESDNNGCDILFRLLGGTEIVNQYIHSLGINKIAVKATEEEMHKNWDVQYTNWSTPEAMGQLLDMFYKGKILTTKTKDYLYQLMIRTNSGPGRIKGLLPKGTIVAHKTGSSGENDKGIAAATNDIGIVTLPDGNHFIIVVFVSDSSANENERDKIIAGIARVVWDFHVNH